MNLIGDVKGKVAVMVDDMIDTAGTEMTSVSKCYLEIVLSWKNILDVPLVCEMSHQVGHFENFPGLVR